MPSLSPTMTRGNIVEWKKKVGDKVAPGEVYCTVETDKATVDFESQEDGFLAKILVPSGTADVTVGTLVAVIADSKEDVAAFGNFTGAAAPAMAASAGVAASTGGSVAASSSPSSSAAPSAGGRVFASPLAKTAAAAAGVNLASIVGTGPRSRIVKADVEDFVKAAAAAPKVAAVPVAAAAAAPTPASAAAAAAPAATSEGGYKDIPHTGMRKVIADRLLQSKTTIPHYYLTVECEVDELMKYVHVFLSDGRCRGAHVSLFCSWHRLCWQGPRGAQCWRQGLEAVRQ